MNPADHLPPSALRLLGSILDCCNRGERPTIRRITPQGRGGRTMHLLVLLREAGLVSWEDGKSATLRPTCRVILFKEDRP